MFSRIIWWTLFNRTLCPSQTLQGKLNIIISRAGLCMEFTHTDCFEWTSSLLFCCIYIYLLSIISTYIPCYEKQFRGSISIRIVETHLCFCIICIISFFIDFRIYTWSYKEACTMKLRKSREFWLI